MYAVLRMFSLISLLWMGNKCIQQQQDLLKTFTLVFCRDKTSTQRRSSSLYDYNARSIIRIMSTWPFNKIMRDIIDRDLSCIQNIQKRKVICKLKRDNITWINWCSLISFQYHFGSFNYLDVSDLFSDKFSNLFGIHMINSTIEVNNQ